MVLTPVVSSTTLHGFVRHFHSLPVMISKFEFVATNQPVMKMYSYHWWILMHDIYFIFGRDMYVFSSKLNKIANIC